jgi:copper chaperone
MHAMRSDLLLRVEGMTCDGCAAAVARAIRRLDPEADVAVDRDHAYVAVPPRAHGDSLGDALTQAGAPASPREP